MKVTNKTAYATIGCDVQLSENDRLALGVELDKIVDWLDSVDAPEGTTESIKAINKIVAFISKFAIRPSQSNVFTDSSEDFKKAEDPHLLANKTKTVIEPVPTEDDVITVDVANNKKIKKIDLTKIIYSATEANICNINDLLNSAESLHIPSISFKCTRKPKEEIVDELKNAGYTVVLNTDKSLNLERYMVGH